MAIVCTLGVNVARQGQDTQSALNPPRQNFDENVRLTSSAITEVTTQYSSSTSTLQPDETKDGIQPKNNASESVASTPNRLFDADIAFQEIEFGTRDIDTLLTHGAVPFDLPGHAPVTLKLHDHQQQFGGDRISVQHGNTLSTITRRGDTVFATIALPTGSFRVEGQGNVSRVYPHRTLAQRANLYEVDYRHVH